MAIDIDLKAVMEIEDELPRLTRGRSSDDYEVLIEAIRSGKVHSIPDVSEEQRAKLGQKIRGAAAKANLPVTVRYSKPATKLYFQLNSDKLPEPVVVQPETTNAKAKPAAK